MTKPTPIPNLKEPHPDQARIDALAAKLLRETAPFRGEDGKPDGASRGGSDGKDSGGSENHARGR